MPSQAKSIIDYDLEALAVMLTETPSALDKLADAIAERLDRKFGFRQGEMAAGFEQLNEKFDRLESKVDAIADNMDRRLDTMDNNFKALGQRIDLLERESTRRFDAIDAHLGVDSTNRSAK